MITSSILNLKLKYILSLVILWNGLYAPSWLDLESTFFPFQKPLMVGLIDAELVLFQTKSVFWQSEVRGSTKTFKHMKNIQQFTSFILDYLRLKIDEMDIHNSVFLLRVGSNKRTTHWHDLIIHNLLFFNRICKKLKILQNQT